MPLLGIVVLLILLFLRREFIPRQIENEELRIENLGADGGTLGESALPKRVESEELKVKSDGEPDGEAPSGASAGGDAPTARPQPDEKGGALAESTSAGKVETDVPKQPVAREWPKFTLSGIAVGRERLAMLSTGEMLTAGEVAKCGVKVEKVESASVVFSWHGEAKTLRKGEQSDKPADAPNALGNK